MNGKLSIIAVSQLMDKFKNESVKDSWRFIYREVRRRRDDEQALMFVQLHAKSATCKTCGVDELPMVKIVQKAGDSSKFYVGSFCSHCGILLKNLEVKGVDHG
ncbi:MAG: hypothetical protein PHP57_06355 [Sideroxydans sp.]|nr:hypothetical protein [Sideroxydans sp.]